MTMEDIRGAVARGWCAPVNAGKEMDVFLAMAISQEVQKLFIEETKEWARQQPHMVG